MGVTMVLILECIVVCFILFLPCVVVIANGTEDLRPYIPRKTKTVKWLITIVCSPIIAAVLAGIMMVVL